MTTYKGSIVCQSCGIDTPRRGNVQKYCPECSAERDIERKKLFARANPGRYDPVAKKAQRQETHAARRAAGMEGSDRRGLDWYAGSEPDLVWSVMISLPFDYAISKNHIWASTRQGHVYLRAEHRKYRDAITLQFRSALRKQTIKQNRVWLDVLVQKPNHKGDAINVLDGVCDALKDAIGLDDRWFSVRRLDWEVVKDDPRIFIRVGQEDVEDVQVCSYCGRMLTMDNFTNNRTAKTGKGRTCRSCSSAASKALKARRAEAG